MPFADGKRAAFTIPGPSLKSLVEAFLRTGYQEHRHRKMRRPYEVLALQKLFTARKQARQCHVQVVSTDNGQTYEIYAHTEPPMTGFADIFRHGFSALFDKASFAAGARMVREDLRSTGFVIPRASRSR